MVTTANGFGIGAGPERGYDLVCMWVYCDLSLTAFPLSHFLCFMMDHEPPHQNILTSICYHYPREYHPHPTSKIFLPIQALLLVFHLMWSFYWSWECSFFKIAIIYLILLWLIREVLCDPTRMPKLSQIIHIIFLASILPFKIIVWLI